jgi:hypothetical protein
MNISPLARLYFSLILLTLVVLVIGPTVVYQLESTGKNKVLSDCFTREFEKGNNEKPYPKICTVLQSLHDEVVWWKYLLPYCPIFLTLWVGWLLSINLGLEDSFLHSRTAKGFRLIAFVSGILAIFYTVTTGLFAISDAPAPLRYYFFMPLYAASGALAAPFLLAKATKLLEVYRTPSYLKIVLAGMIIAPILGIFFLYKVPR